MDGRSERFLQRCINHPVSFNPVFPFKCGCGDGDEEMAAAFCTSMAGMFPRFIFDMQADRRKNGLKRLPDRFQPKLTQDFSLFSL